MPLAVANSVGEPSAHFTVERLRTAYGEESVAHSHSQLSIPRDPKGSRGLVRLLRTLLSALLL
jgi:hypothetical protein